MIVNITMTGIGKCRIISFHDPVFKEYFTGINLAYN